MAKIIFILSSFLIMSRILASDNRPYKAKKTELFFQASWLSPG
jgi:hypothetical protein